MSATESAEAFLKYRIRLGQCGSLSNDDAFDVASFLIRQPRPDFARRDAGHRTGPCSARQQ